MTPTVSSHGYGSAEIFFLGGYPLREDLLQGAALVGHTENTLNGFLRPHKLTVKNTYRSVWIREKLEYSGQSPKKLREALSKVDTEGYTKLLKEELEQVKPNVVVPLDDLALGAVFPHIHGIKKPRGRKHWIQCYRGSIVPLRLDWNPEKKTRVIPTYSPFMLYADFNARAYVQIDFQRIVFNKSIQEPIQEYGLLWICRSAEAFRNYLNRSFEKNPEFLVFDIETFGGLITCISFSFDGFEGVSVPLCDWQLPPAERALLWKLVAKLLAHPIPKANQNIKYDWTILERHGFYVANVLGDTMLAGHLVYPEFPRGLDFYTSIYTPIAYYKDEGKEFDPRVGRDKLYFYNAKDSVATHLVAQKQKEDLEELGLTELYREEIVPMIAIYKDIDETGIRVDAEQKKKLNERYESLYESNLKVLRDLTDSPELNPRSTQQVGILLYENLKFPKRTKTDETGKKSYKTDKDTLDELLIHYAEESKAGALGAAILARIVMCRKLSKVIEYINTPLHPDGRFHGVSNLAGTGTGRSSFSKSLDEIYDEKKRKLVRLGRSLQTITKHGFEVDEDIFDDFGSSSIAGDLRSMFVPDRDFYFVECDGSQAEARDVAVLAEDYDLLADFDRRPKIHAKTAALLFGVDASIITSTSPSVPKLGVPFYDIGKRVRHAGNYNMGAFRLSQMTHLKLGECKTLLDKFHGANPRIRNVFHLEVIKFVRKHRYLTTALGRRRGFYGEINDKFDKEALAFLPQSRISDLTKFTLRRVRDELRDLYLRKFWFLTEQHDGVLAQVHKDEWERYAVTYKRIYERKINFLRCCVPRDIELSIPCEVHVGKESWMGLEEVKLAA